MFTQALIYFLGKIFHGSSPMYLLLTEVKSQKYELDLYFFIKQSLFYIFVSRFGFFFLPFFPSFFIVVAYYITGR